MYVYIAMQNNTSTVYVCIYVCCLNMFTEQKPYVLLIHRKKVILIMVLCYWPMKYVLAANIVYFIHYDNGCVSIFVDLHFDKPNSYVIIVMTIMDT